MLTTRLKGSSISINRITERTWPLESIAECANVVELVSSSREEQPQNNPISETPLPSPGHLAGTPELVSSQRPPSHCSRPILDESASVLGWRVWIRMPAISPRWRDLTLVSQPWNSCTNSGMYCCWHYSKFATTKVYVATWVR